MCSSEAARTKTPNCPLKIFLSNRRKICYTVEPKYLWGTHREPVIFDLQWALGLLNYNLIIFLDFTCTICFVFSQSQGWKFFDVKLLHFLYFRLFINDNQSQNTKLETPKKCFRKLKWCKRRYIVMKKKIYLDFCSWAWWPCLFWCPWRKYCLPALYTNRNAPLEKIFPFCAWRQASYQQCNRIEWRCE